MTERAVVLDQVRALIDEEFVLAVRTQKLDAGVAQILVMDVEFLAAFGAAGIEMLDHGGLLLGILLFGSQAWPFGGRASFVFWRPTRARCCTPAENSAKRRLRISMSCAMMARASSG